MEEKDKQKLEFIKNFLKYEPEFIFGNCRIGGPVPSNSTNKE